MKAIKKAASHYETAINLKEVYLVMNEKSRRPAKMGESVKYLLSQEQLNQIAAVASKEAVRIFRSEQSKADKKRAKNDDKVRRTKNMLRSYRRMKATLSEEATFTEEEKIELRWKFIEDLMGNSTALVSKSEMVTINSEKKRQENLYCIHCIENAIRLYGEECNKSSSEEGKRRFRELYALYIDEIPSTVTEIAERENISEKTVYKDLGIACSIIAVYLLGM